MTIMQFEMHTVPEVLKGIKIIDMDTHFVEPPDLWTSRAPAKYKDMVPYVIRTGDVDQWMFNDKPMGPVSITVIRTNREKQRGAVTLDTYDQVDPSTYDPRERIKLMDDMNIHAQVVFPNAAGFGGGAFQRLMPEDNRNFCLRVYNDAVAEWARMAPGRLFPQGLVPFRDIKEATREARRIKEELGLSGISATSAPELYAGVPDYGDPAWDPFWEVCSELDLPISFHVGTGGVLNRSYWKSFVDTSLIKDPDDLAAIQKSSGTKGMAPIAVIAVTGHLGNASILMNLMYSGLLDRWPKLKFISVESGIGWIPFLLECAEWQFDEMGNEQRWGLTRRPREYFRDHMYVSWWMETIGPKKLLYDVGVNNVLFETDFPHPTCLYPDPLQHAAGVMKDHPYEVRKRVMQDNSAELWKIPV